jgi:hypothetical protein
MPKILLDFIVGLTLHNITKHNIKNKSHVIFENSKIKLYSSLIKRMQKRKSLVLFKMFNGATPRSRVRNSEVMQAAQCAGLFLL